MSCWPQKDFLEQVAVTNIPEFCKALSDVNNSQVARKTAGLQLKNRLTSKDPQVKQQFQ